MSTLVRSPDAELPARPHNVVYFQVLKTGWYRTKPIEYRHATFSQENVHYYDKSQIDDNAEGFFKYCKDLTAQVHAILTTADGNCFSHAVSYGLNGDQFAQVYELKLRGAVAYYDLYKTIHKFGMDVGFAKATGKFY